MFNKFLVVVIFSLTVVSLRASVGIPFDVELHKEWFYLPHILDKVPYKSQEDSKVWTEYINKTHDQNWRFHPEIRIGSFKCMSFAASTVCDWWNLELGIKGEFPEYRNFTHGLIERGERPRALEAQYYYRRELGESHFRLLSKLIKTDPLTREHIAMDPAGYCKILANPLPPRDYPDPLLGAEFASYKGKSDYGMDGEWIELFDVNIVGGYEKNTAILKSALHKHGIVYAGVENVVPIGWAIHVVCIVGYGEKDGKTWFVYRESFGHPEHSKPETTEPAYRIAIANRFNDAYCFPHRLRCKIEPDEHNGAYNLEVRNSKGKLVDLCRIVAKTSTEQVRLPIEHKDTGVYTFTPLLNQDSAKAMSWEAKITFNKEFHYDKTGKDYEIVVPFTGTKRRHDLQRARFRALSEKSLLD